MKRRTIWIIGMAALALALLTASVVGVAVLSDAKENEVTNDNRTPQQRLREQNALRDLVAPGLDANARIDQMWQIATVQSVKITPSGIMATLMKRSALVGDAVTVPVRDVPCLTPVAVGDHVLWGQPNGPRSEPICWGTAYPYENYGMPFTRFDPARSVSLDMTGGETALQNVVNLEGYGVRGLRPFFALALSGNVIVDRGAVSAGARFDLGFRLAIRRAGSAFPIAELTGPPIPLEAPIGTGAHTIPLSHNGLYGALIGPASIDVGQDDAFTLTLEVYGQRTANTGVPPTLTAQVNVETLTLLEMATQLSPLVVVD